MLFDRFYTIIFIFILVLFTAQAYSEEGDIGPLNKILERAEECEKIILAPNYLPDYKKKAGKKLKKLSEIVKSSALQQRIKQYQNRLAKDLVDPAYQVNSDDSVDKKDYSDFLLDSSERIYVFISSSVPVSTLRNYAGDIHRLGDPNISMVMTQQFPMEGILQRVVASKIKIVGYLYINALKK